MRPPCSTRPIIFGFIVAIGITLTLPHFAFGAARSFGGSGRFRGSTIQRQHFISPSFNRFGFNRCGFNGFGCGFLGGGGIVGEQPVIIIQPFQPEAASEPAESRIYVQPRWVDGGYGVQVLQPGYWADPKQAEKR